MSKQSMTTPERTPEEGTLQEHNSFFDQDKPEVPIVGVIAEVDDSEPYELDATAVFKARDKGYLVVNVSGCSCWPDRGSTQQRYCATKADVDRLLREWQADALLDACQAANWKVAK